MVKERAYDRFIDFFTMSLKNITMRRTRSWLTMVGIFIGIAAVVALISLGQGLQGAINNEFEGLGMDKITVMSKGGFFGVGGVPALTNDDITLIDKVTGVEKAAGYVFTTARVEWGKDDLWYQIIAGYPADKAEQDILMETGIKLEYGRMFKAGDKYKAVLGYDYRTSSVFTENLKLGDTVTINNKDFEVIGFNEKVGNPNDDRTIIIPEDTARELLNIPDRVDTILVKVKSGQDADVVAANIERAMRKDRGQKEGDEDFAVQTFKELLKSFLTILDIVTTVIVGIAAISLLVGGIGIMNTMYTSVLERTKEIGIMKAIGATNNDVMFLFLIESGLLGLAGGIIGIIIGAGLSSIAAYLAQTLGGFEYLKAAFPWYLIVGALAFSFLVGVASGIFPSRQAARKNPVDSLRYE